MVSAKRRSAASSAAAEKSRCVSSCQTAICRICTTSSGSLPLSFNASGSSGISSAKNGAVSLPQSDRVSRRCCTSGTMRAKVSRLNDQPSRAVSSASAS